jgi:hypothetical protein|tara:strand:- start:2958 stop:3230 length:273 start_codon:yes stop_codon:yes gene_type:complete
MMTKKEQAADQTAGTEAEAPVEAPGLELQDLALVLNLVNVSIKRGTFERAELRGVLDVTDKLDAFLQFQAQAQATAKEQDQANTSKEGEQ